MQRTSKIVRTKKVYKTHNNDLRYEINMMPITLYDSRSYYRFVDQTFEIYPYKWYDLRYLIDYPYYYLSKYFNKSFKNDLNINNIKSRIISLIIFIINSSIVGVIGWIAVDIIKYIFKVFIKN